MPESKNDDQEVVKRRRTTVYQNKDDPDYNPFQYRDSKYPTSDCETLIHLLKGAMGSGIFAMPYAFKNGGLWFSFGGCISIALLCVYCMHVLVKCAHIISFRQRIPNMDYPELAKNAFLELPERYQRAAKGFSILIKVLLAFEVTCVCCIYLIYVSRNVKQVWDFYELENLSIRIWIAIFTAPMILIGCIRNLKYLVPFSIIADIALVFGLVVTLVFIFTDIPPLESVQPVGHYTNIPVFITTTIFALECVGVIMALENNMRYPAHFTGCPSVLCISGAIATTLYTLIGFFGYLKYGEATEAAVTLNLPEADRWAQAVKILIGASVYFSFPLQFYVPVNIFWKDLQKYVRKDRQTPLNYALRVMMVLTIGSVAIVLPKIGPIISLVGAICLSVLDLIAPALIESLVYYYDPGYGFWRWRIVKNSVIMLFGLFVLVAGTAVSILDFYKEFKDGIDVN